MRSKIPRLAISIRLSVKTSSFSLVIPRLSLEILGILYIPSRIVFSKTYNNSRRERRILPSFKTRWGKFCRGVEPKLLEQQQIVCGMSMMANVSLVFCRTQVKVKGQTRKEIHSSFFSFYRHWLSVGECNSARRNIPFFWIWSLRRSSLTWFWLWYTNACEPRHW